MTLRKKGGIISLEMRWVACVAGNRSAFVVSVSCRKCFCFVPRFQFQLSFIFKYLKKPAFIADVVVVAVAVVAIAATVNGFSNFLT